jgi:hypothetical protein
MYFVVLRLFSAEFPTTTHSPLKMNATPAQQTSSGATARYAQPAAITAI